MNSVNAGTSVYLSVSPLDGNGNPAAPLSAQYRVDDLGSGVNLIPLTALTVSTSMQIALGTTATAAVGTSGAPQTRVVTVLMTYGANDELNVVYMFQVTPLQF